MIRLYLGNKDVAENVRLPTIKEITEFLVGVQDKADLNPIMPDVQKMIKPRDVNRRNSLSIRFLLKLIPAVFQGPLRFNESNNNVPKIDK